MNAKITSQMATHLFNERELEVKRVEIVVPLWTITVELWESAFFKIIFAVPLSMTGLHRWHQVRRKIYNRTCTDITHNRKPAWTLLMKVGAVDDEGAWRGCSYDPHTSSYFVLQTPYSRKILSLNLNGFCVQWISIGLRAKGKLSGPKFYSCLRQML